MSLRTTNRKVADQERLTREFDLARERLPSGPVRPGPVVSLAWPMAAVEAVDRSAADLTTIRADYAAWSAAHKRPKTILNDSGRLSAFFATVPGKALPAVTTADVERFLTREALKGRQPATLLRHREILHALRLSSRSPAEVPLDTSIKR